MAPLKYHPQIPNHQRYFIIMGNQKVEPRNSMVPTVSETAPPAVLIRPRFLQGDGGGGGLPFCHHKGRVGGCLWWSSMCVASPGSGRPMGCRYAARWYPLTGRSGKAVDPHPRPLSRDGWTLSQRVPHKLPLRCAKTAVEHP